MAPTLRRLVDPNVTIDFHCDPVGFAAIDARSITQITTNLVLNAAQAIGHDAGIIDISVTDRDAAGVELAVADTGHGMTTEQTDRMFDPFYTTKPHGRGLAWRRWQDSYGPGG